MPFTLSYGYEWLYDVIEINNVKDPSIIGSCVHVVD